jgi:hypothetical protein
MKSDFRMVKNRSPGSYSAFALRTSFEIRNSVFGFPSEFGFRCSVLFRIVAVWVICALRTVEAATSSAVQNVPIAPFAAKSHVPEVTAQSRFLAPQAVAVLDISADGRFITVGTMAFSHDANVWQLAPDGAIIAKRHFPPWAPMQVATLPGGHAMAVGLAYSRVTSPDPTVWLGRSTGLLVGNLKDDLAEADSRDGQLARLRPGAGDWRTGWLASSLGELFVRGPDWIFKPESRFLDAEGQVQNLSYADRNLLPTSRAMRMASSRDGRRLAFGWLGFSQKLSNLPAHPDLISVWRVKPNERRWSAPPLAGPPPALPDPINDFGDLAKNFRLAADALVPGHVASAIALNRDGSRVAVVEDSIVGWVRNAPAIGKWDPPIHVLNFLPRQRGRLRVFDGDGREVYRQWLPAEGMFEIGFSNDGNEIWCWPAAWFARGVAGAVWLPVDSPARTVYRIGTDDGSTAAFDFPDAVSDLSISPTSGHALVSCWDGQIYLLDRAGNVSAKIDTGGTARLAWSGDGSFAMAGTAEGRLLRLERNGALAWSNSIPVASVPPLLDHRPRSSPVCQFSREAASRRASTHTWATSGLSGAGATPSWSMRAESPAFPLLRHDCRPWESSG